MHPMFVKLFLETDEDELPAEKQKRRPATLARRNPPRSSRKAAVRMKNHRTRRSALEITGHDADAWGGRIGPENAASGGVTGPPARAARGRRRGAASASAGYVPFH
jgi:hypothetical protein